MAKYTSQFVPTDFNTLTNVVQMYRQDMQQRNQEFDQAANFESEAIAQLGMLPSYDLEGRKKRLEELQSNLKSILDKRQGDYGAASKDIVRLIAKERNNPWYQINSEQQEAIKNYKQLGLNADNIVLGNPYMSVDEIQRKRASGEDPLNVSALSKSLLYDKASDIAANYAKSMITDPEYKSILGGQYFQRISREGISPEDLDYFIDSGAGSKVIEGLLSEYPQLKGINKNIATDIIKQGLTKAIGRTDIQELINRGETKNEKSSKLPDVIGTTGTGIRPDNIDDLSNKFFQNKANEKAKEVASKYNIPGVDSLEDLKNINKRGYKIAETKEGQIRMGQYAPMLDMYNKSEYYEQGKKALKEVNEWIKNEPDKLALNRYNINILARARKKTIDEVKSLRETLNSETNRYRDKLIGFKKSDNNELEKMKDFEVRDFSYDFSNPNKTGLIFYLVGKDINNDNKTRYANVYLSDTEFDLQDIFVNYLSDLKPEMKYDLGYGKYGDEYLKWLENQIPNVDQEQAIGIQNYIDSKKK